MPTVNVKKAALISLIPIIVLLMTYFYLNQDIVVSGTQFIMNTTIEIKLYGKHKEKKNLEDILNKAFNLIKEVEDHSTSYTSYEGNTAFLNENRGSWQEVNRDVIEQLKTSITFYEMTSGEFNIGLFRSVNLWKSSDKADIIPSREMAKATLGKSTPLDIKVDEFNSRVLLPDDMELDLGAVTKGYSLDVASKYLRQAGVSKALLNAGGNIYAIGNPTDREYYNIAVQDPHNMSKSIGTVKLKDGQVIATSGSYNRYYDFAGVKYSHILSGNTGFPKDLYKSVTVITDKGIISDILSTSLFLLSIEDGRKLIEKLDHPVEVLYVTNDNKVYKTEDFKIEYSEENTYLDK